MNNNNRLLLVSLTLLVISLSMMVRLSCATKKADEMRPYYLAAYAAKTICEEDLPRNKVCVITAKPEKEDWK